MVDSELLVTRAIQIAHDKKAENVKVLDVSERIQIADYFVICTVQNRRQAQAICSEIDYEMKHSKVPKARIEGFDSGWWILLDYDIVVIHVFHEEARDYYDLESLWADATDITERFASALDAPAAKSDDEANRD
ncbi:MAG: ribosome silencing factor [Planctomycetota bacterium]|nr:MAG: ribosome silencing factor [Planctomycetota bacterium]